MEERELKLLEKFAPQNPELKALWDEHMLYNRQLEKLAAQASLTPAEAEEMKALKLRKLEGKTKMLDLLEKLAKEAE